MVNEKIIKLNVTDYLDKAFKVLPSNANIDKGRCGIGGTTLEIKAKRNSIVIVCSLGGIIGKANDNVQIYPIYGRIKPKQIAIELKKDITDRKIFVTPNSFWKIIEAAKINNSLDELYKNYFVLYDESHTAITEMWRPDVLAPFKWFWEFKNKTLISATPCEFNDSRFKSLDQYKIEFHQKYIGKINIVKCDNINSCVDAHIANSCNLPGDMFFFFNSVTEIADTIKRNELKNNVHIYCADKGDNYEKLENQLEAFRQKPETDKYAKINFFTTRYFESFDLHAENATIILVTDVNKANTRNGIGNKGVQAVGLLRNIPHELIHITNHRNKQSMKTRTQFKAEYNTHKNLIKHYNSYIRQCTNANILPLESSKHAITPFSKFNENNLLATFDQNKLDQIINELVCNEEFNHINFIEDAWKKAKFEVSVTEHHHTVTSKESKRLSKTEKFKQIISKISDLESNKDSFAIGAFTKEINKIQNESPLAIDAYYKLGLDRLDELGYKEKKIQELLIDLHNETAKARLLKLLGTEFLFGKEYTNEHIINRLQFLYNLVGLKKKDGSPLTAYLVDLEKNGWLKLRGCKLTNNKGRVNGSRIEKVCFTLKNVA